MQRCLKCLIDNADHRRFCRRCGTALLLPCPRCGFANGPDDLFCGGCGGRIETKADLPSERSAAELEPTAQKAPQGLFSKEEIEGLVETQKTRVAEEPEKSAFDQGDIDKIFGEKE